MGYGTSQNIHNLTEYVVPINSFLNVSKTFVIIENVEDIPNNASIGVTDSLSLYRTSKREDKFQESKILWLKIKTISLSYALHKVFLQLFFHKYQRSKRLGGWLCFVSFFFNRSFRRWFKKQLMWKRNDNQEPLNSNSGYRNPELGISLEHTNKYYDSVAKGRIPLWKSKGLPAQADLLYLLYLLWRGNYLLKTQSPDTIFVATWYTRGMNAFQM